MDRTRRPQEFLGNHVVGSNNGQASSGDDSPVRRDSDSAMAFDDAELNYRQVQQLTQRLGSSLASRDVDAAYKEYAKVRDHAALCRSLLLRGGSNKNGNDDNGPDQEARLSAVREWKDRIQALLQALRDSLSETYVSYEPGATPEMVEALFRDREFRESAIQGMRRARIERTLPGFSRARYDGRFRNYDRVEGDLVEVGRVLRVGESSGGREVRECVISPRGDAVLEFAGVGEEEKMPVLRFRVSSTVLAETSPVFERMFTGRGDLEMYDEEEEGHQVLPSLPPTTYVCDDGTEAKLYRMPRADGEEEEEQALRTLLHAAHLHNDEVPREVSFELFVAVARVCLRYRCTSPLELVVEHRWLPAWIHKGSETMPDGMLVISYAFGFRQLFARMSKTAVLNLRDGEEVAGKRGAWPGRMRERIWGVREAKMAQVRRCCEDAVGEYLRPPPPLLLPEEEGAADVEHPGPQAGAARLRRTPRCPKGDHLCDATNLGWLMMMYAELQILPAVMNSTHSQQQQQTPRRSLAQLVDQIRAIASPPHAVHRGAACDPVPLLRAAVNDVYNSVSGLTLHDVSGRAHGWGLSRHRSRQVQAVLQRGLRKMGEAEERKRKEQEESKVVKEETEGKKPGTRLEMTDAVRLGILREVDCVEDLHAAALASRAFYRTFKDNEPALVERFVRAHRRRTLMRLTSEDVVAAGEQKVPKGEGDVIKAEEAGARDQANGVGDEEGGSSVEMTHEEAQRILWPAEESTRATTSEGTSDQEAMREKFLAGDAAFREGKMLLAAEGKLLGEDRDRRVGLLRDDE